MCLPQALRTVSGHIIGVQYIHCSHLDQLLSTLAARWAFWIFFYQNPGNSFYLFFSGVPPPHLFRFNYLLGLFISLFSLSIQCSGFLWKGYFILYVLKLCMSEKYLYFSFIFDVKILLLLCHFYSRAFIPRIHFRLFIVGKGSVLSSLCWVLSRFLFSFALRYLLVSFLWSFSSFIFSVISFWSFY